MFTDLLSLLKPFGGCTKVVFSKDRFFKFLSYYRITISDTGLDCEVTSPWGGVYIYGTGSLKVKGYIRRFFFNWLEVDIV